MAAKRRKIRRSKEFIRRSRASKKGWETRRKKQELVKEIEKSNTRIRNAKKGVKKKQVKKLTLPKKPKAPKKKKRTVEELEELLAYKDKQLEILRATRHWEHAMPPEYLHEDGTIALRPSRIRHWPDKIKNKIYSILDKGNRKGDFWFNRAADFIAGSLNIPIREVYTFWFSP